LYVASGDRLFIYYGDGVWGIVTSLGRRIMQLAATSSHFYVLCEGPNNIGIILRAEFPSYFGGTAYGLSSWETINVFQNVQAIYAAGDVLFFSTKNLDNTYAIYNVNELSKPIKNAESVAAVFRGAAVDGDNYYLCTNLGIFIVDDLTVNEARLINLSYGLNFIGMINLGANGGNRVVAVNYNGMLFSVNPPDTDRPVSITLLANFMDNRRTTGALAVWTSGSHNLLLVGRKDTSYSARSGYTYGYTEIQFDSNGRIIGTFREPATLLPSTVFDRARYISSIGTNPVNHLFQARDGTVFASTQKNGVWSLRLGQWNAERQHLSLEVLGIK
jgi:hypothetical protein